MTVSPTLRFFTNMFRYISARSCCRKVGGRLSFVLVTLILPERFAIYKHKKHISITIIYYFTLNCILLSITFCNLQTQETHVHHDYILLYIKLYTTTHHVLQSTNTRNTYPSRLYTTVHQTVYYYPSQPNCSVESVHILQ